ncbi:hypothetical protein GCM10027341_23990 [Spirosoma knui]
MKKLIFTGAALIALAISAYAQVINQQGQQQFAQHNQFGQNQTSIINQVQAPNDPNRTNYGNYAITFQGTPANTGANSLLINQNDGSQGNRAGITQSGGPGNEAGIDQSGGPDGLSGGGVSVSATVGSRGEDGNFAGILQVGSGNIALIEENNNSRRNTAEAYQNGNTNQAGIRQSNNSIGNTAFVRQGFSEQNVPGTPVSGAQAIVVQGKELATDVSFGPAVSEAVGNTASIIQTASDVQAQISQGSIFYPDPSFGSGRAEGSEAQITQTATQTGALIFQGVGSGESIGSKASVTQSAPANIGIIIQGIGLGTDYQSTATIVQNGAGNTVPNSAFIVQGLLGASEYNQATIIQSSNAANSAAQILQGNDNISSLEGGSFSSGDIAHITQNGQGTAATINQNTLTTGIAGFGQSKGRDNKAFITQGAGVVGNGDINIADEGSFTTNPGATGVALIDQGVNTQGVVLQTSRNTAIIDQVTGSGLRAHIAQGLVGTDFGDAAGNVLGATSLTGTSVVLLGFTSSDNAASITQLSGDNHNANIFQTGLFNKASVSQANGNAHQALIVQAQSSNRARAEINQRSTGSNNVATILQFTGSNADGVGSFGNEAIINQIAGSNNVAFLQQGQTGAVSSSNDNFILLTQNGSGNVTYFLQTGNNNFADIAQNGNNNIVKGVGAGNDVALQNGYNNRLTLVQNGNSSSNLVYEYSQVGNNNTQVVTQNAN